MSNPQSNSKIGVIVPSFFEAQFIDGRSNKGVLFGMSGMGKLRAAWTVHRMQQQGCKVVLLTGFAGGLWNANPGDIVTASKAIEGDYDTRPLEDYPNALDMRPLDVAGSDRSIFVCQDRLLTSNVYLHRTSELGIPYGSCVVTDMEAHAVAFAGKSLKIPVFVVKMVSDRADGNAEKDFLSACSKMSGKLNKVISESISLIRKRVFHEENG